ncbi:DNA polymerase III subunit gamma/tau [Kiloniella spongiae]|uniref:DNA polymerase III subunit gamma/tau n=1 Tax=Kiloniella spongiae TaxID=1489064 RepID=A0A0H2MNW4_9PROT|nr:DNA polymerase III subunit gamma/tau [Kiloniella spongiae]KLN62422.1 DNA polymerase III subunit gamma/tau [Kiloniella spongiae]
MNDISTEQADSESESSAAYQVLARKYRPASFSDLYGQDALVQTITNAIDTDRLAHAFILTGVRGVGKTTSARIIAKALNCIGVDGQGGPTADPCGVCESCTSIAQDRHVDVMEMDAASRTGVGDIRELIESVRYRPVSARKKVYIIDEVHMLSNSAFNALLKTLEEPPEHVVFIFATTEIRKVPVTVLSRCQRFDLRRLEHEELIKLFTMILGKEKIEFEDEAIGLLARAADGSARDGLSLLDQSIALGGGEKIESEPIRHMLGMADRTRIFDLYDALMQGDCPESLNILSDLYNGGAEPLVVMKDLLELSHLLTRAKLVPQTLEAPGIPEAERVRGGEMCTKLSMPLLARTWQMLLKGLGEIQIAPHPLQATEMVIIRLAYASNLPTPGDLIKKLQDAPAGNAPAGGVQNRAGGEGARITTGPQTSARGIARGGQAVAVDTDVTVSSSATTKPELVVDNTSPDVGFEEEVYASPQTFRDVINLARDQGERILSAYLGNDVHLIRFSPGEIEYKPAENAPRDLSAKIQRHLSEWTGKKWKVTETVKDGVDTIRAQEKQINQALDDKAMQDPLVLSVLKLFPGTKLISRKGLMPDNYVVEGVDEKSLIDQIMDPDMEDPDLDDAELLQRLNNGDEI